MMKVKKCLILTSGAFLLGTLYISIQLSQTCDQGYADYHRMRAIEGEDVRDRDRYVHGRGEALRDKLSDLEALDGMLNEAEEAVVMDPGTSRPLLHNMAIPNILHFVWCEQRMLTFKPHLAIKSAIRALQPFSVVYHSEKSRIWDKKMYNNWIFELEHDYPIFVDLRMDAETAKICHGNLESRRDAILKLLQGEGGMYVGENTWLLNLPPERFNVDLEMALKPGTMEGYVMMRKGLAKSNDTLAGLVNRVKAKDSSGNCIMSEELPWWNMKDINCMVVTEKRYDHRIVPRDIMERKDTFGKITRWIYYGTTKILKPAPNYDELVPNIGHIVWLGPSKPDFTFYLSVLSLLYVVKVDKVYVHSDRVPVGINWKMLTSNKDVMKRLVNVIRPRPVYYYQNYYPDPQSMSLLSNYLRVEILINYGGFYSDADAVWVKPFTREERAYEAAASYDWVDWNLPFPEVMNLGVSYAKKNSRFMRIWRDRMRKNFRKHIGYVGTRMSYKIWERYPQTLRVDPHLQVMCYLLICHPTWEPFFHNGKIGHPQTGSMDNWRNVTHAVHWTTPNPPAFKNMSTLLHSHGLFADIGKMVLSKAGLLKT